MTTTNIVKSLGASDIDTQELVTNLVNATKEPRQKLIDRDKKRAEVAVSNLGLLKSALSTLQDAATELGSSSKLNQVVVTSSNLSALSAKKSGVGIAREGTYSVVINQLATPDRKILNLTSSTVTSDQVLSISRGALSKEFTFPAGTTAASIVSAINADPVVGSLDIRATVITTNDSARPYAIVLEGNTGAANAFSVANTAGDQLGFTNSVPAADAELTVNGVDILRSSNTVTDAISGISLDLIAANEVGDSVTLSVANDSTSVISKVQNFVDTYNLIREFLVKATGEPVAGDDIAGSLRSDVNARSILNKIRGTLTDASSSSAGDVSHWSSLGVSLDRNGKLSLDADKFKAVFDANPDDAIMSLSSGASTPRIYAPDSVASGLAGDMARVAYKLNTSTGVVATMTTGYENRLSNVEKRQSNLDEYIERITAQYERQFAALNAALNAFKNTQKQLEQSLNLNKDN